MSTIKDLRKKTVEILDAHFTTGVTVLDAKSTPTGIKSYPIVNVFVESFTNTRGQLNLTGWLSEINLQIVILVAANNSWADALDDLIDDVTVALLNSQEWRSEWNSVNEYGVQYSVSEDRETTLGRADITITGTILTKFKPV